MAILFSDANSYQRNSAFVTYDRINMRRTNMVFFIIILTKKMQRNPSHFNIVQHNPFLLSLVLILVL